MMRHHQYFKFDLNYSRPIRRAWVAALRSGRYLRGTCCLRNAEGRCCPAGVLCEAFYEMYPGRVKKGIDEKGRTTYDGEAFLVPHTIAELIGLTDKDCRFRDRAGVFMPNFTDPDTMDGWVSMANINDEEIITFEDAARIIEDRSSHIFVES